ncbi:MAG: TVP38/TMEM64 family protein [Gemmataceae bacterium]
MSHRQCAALLKLVLFAALVGTAIYFFRFTETGRGITPDSILRHLESYDPVTLRLVYVVLYILGTVLLFPGTLLSFVGAVLFGAYEGTLWTWVGAVIGATLAFWMAKLLGRDFVDQLLGGRLATLDQRLRDHGFTGLLVIRLIPLFPFNGVNFGSGLTSIRSRDYVLATAIGILPGTFVYQFLFAKFGRRILTEGLKWEYLKDTELWLALSMFVLFLAVGKWFANRVRRKVAADPTLVPNDTVRSK